MHITASSLTATNNIYDVITVPGYICEWGRLSGAKNYLIDHIPVADVPASMNANAGVGKT